MRDAEKQEEGVTQESDLVIRFKRPFTFEGQEYAELDLSGLESLTGSDMQDAERILRAKGISTFHADFSAEGTLLYASQAAGLPIEFFNALPLREARKVKTRVMNFFLE